MILLTAPVSTAPVLFPRRTLRQACKRLKAGRGAAKTKERLGETVASGLMQSFSRHVDQARTRSAADRDGSDDILTGICRTVEDLE